MLDKLWTWLRIADLCPCPSPRDGMFDTGCGIWGRTGVGDGHGRTAFGLFRTGTAAAQRLVLAAPPIIAVGAAYRGKADAGYRGTRRIVPVERSGRHSRDRPARGSVECGRRT